MLEVSRESWGSVLLPGREELAGARQGWRPVSCLLRYWWPEVGCCVFGGQSSGLQNNHGWGSVVKYVLVSVSQTEYICIFLNSRIWETKEGGGEWSSR